MPKENSTHQVDPMDKWVSIEQAANYLGVSVVTVRSWLRAEAANSVLTKRKNKKDDRFPKELVIFFIRKS